MAMAMRTLQEARKFSLSFTGTITLMQQSLHYTIINGIGTKKALAEVQGPL